MKQLSLFDTESTDIHLKKHIFWQLFVDGAARNNPGPAGAGIYVVKEGKPFIKQGFFLGTKTNNQAEYLAVVLGLCQVCPHLLPGDTLEIISDSQLLVRQIQGIYAIKNKELILLHGRVKELLKNIRYSVRHVERAMNSVADSLANQGIDKKNYVPAEFEHLCIIKV